MIFFFMKIKVTHEWWIDTFRQVLQLKNFAFHGNQWGLSVDKTHGTSLRRLFERMCLEECLWNCLCIVHNSAEISTIKNRIWVVARASLNIEKEISYISSLQLNMLFVIIFILKCTCTNNEESPPTQKLYKILLQHK